MGIKMYLAARFGRQQELRGYRERLQAIGFEITSSWLDASRDDGDQAEEQLQVIALANYDDIANAGVFVVFTDEQSFKARGGHHVELGFAEGQGKPTLLVGPATNVFHAVVDMQCENFDELLAVLEKTEHVKGWLGRVLD